MRLLHDSEEGRIRVLPVSSSMDNYQLVIIADKSIQVSGAAMATTNDAVIKQEVILFLQKMISVLNEEND